MDKREQIARIIDPTAFEAMSRGAEYSIYFGDRREKALTAADAILALDDWQPSPPGKYTDAEIERALTAFYRAQGERVSGVHGPREVACFRAALLALEGEG